MAGIGHDRVVEILRMCLGQGIMGSESLGDMQSLRGVLDAPIDRKAFRAIKVVMENFLTICHQSGDE